jgi:acetoin utilization deacetylase AcuC-like enzyme
MHVSSAGFAHMTALIKHSLKRHQKLIMSMEGGYNVHALSRGIDACIQVLLGDAPPELPEPDWFLQHRDTVVEAELAKKRDIYKRDLQLCVLFHSKWWNCLSCSVD